MMSRILSRNLKALEDRQTGEHVRPIHVRSTREESIGRRSKWIGHYLETQSGRHRHELLPETLHCLLLRYYNLGYPFSSALLTILSLSLPLAIINMPILSAITEERFADA